MTMTRFLPLVCILTITSVFPAPRPGGSIVGNVIDADTYYAVSGATVSIGDSIRTAHSDTAGRFAIRDVPPGSYTVEASKTGYVSQVRFSVVVNPDAAAVIDFQLSAEIRDLDKMVVTGAKQRVPGKAATTVHTLTTQQIADQPAGNYDLQRALTTLPGFAGGSDAGNDIVVIGGNYGENLFLIDGIEVFNPNHFSGAAGSGGSFSIIEPALVEKMDFLAGAFPARYGKKAASALSLDLRKGARDRFHVKVDAGMAGAGGTVEGPLAGGSFLLSVHRSFTNIIYKLVDWPFTSAPYYGSVVGKYDRELPCNQRIGFLGVYSDDHSSEYGPTWKWAFNGNQQITGINHALSVGNCRLTSALSYTRQESNGDEQTNYGLQTYYDDFSQSAVSARTNLTTVILDKFNIDAGAAVSRNFFDQKRFWMADTIWHYVPGTDSIDALFAANPSMRYDEDAAFFTGEGYLQAQTTIGSIVTSAAGIRADYYGYTRETVVSPRASLTFHLPESIELSLAGGRYRQPPDAYLLLRDLRNRDLKSRTSDHAVLGLKYSPRSDLTIAAEGFYKRYRDLAIPESDLTADPFDWSQRYVNEGKSRTIGSDFFLVKQLQRNFWGSLAYSYAQSKWYDPRDPSRMFNADLDYRHHLSAIIGYRQKYREAAWFKRADAHWWYRVLKVLPLVPADETDYSLRVRYLGGRPYTPMYYDSTIRHWRTDPDTPINSDRMSPYCRIDFHLKERIYSGRISVVTYIEALNLTDHNNLFSFLFRDDTAEMVERYQMPRVVLGGVIIEY